MGLRQHEGGYRSNRITTATTTAVKATSGVVVRFVLEAAAAGNITFNDSVGSKLILPATFPAGQYELNVGFAGKIEVVTASADRVVVVFD